MSRTISDGSIDLDKFPTSRVLQLAKKLESSKATARHIKQVSGEPQANQINQSQIPLRNKGDHNPATSNRWVPLNNSNRCSKCGDTTHHEGFTCPAKKYQCKACHKFGHLTSQCFQRKQHLQHKYRWPKAHQIQTNEIYDNPDSSPSDVSSSEDSFCLQVKIKQQ